MSKMIASGSSLYFALLVFQIIAMSRGLEFRDIKSLRAHFLRKRSAEDGWKLLRDSRSNLDGHVLIYYIDAGTGEPYVTKIPKPLEPRLGRSNEVVYEGGHFVTYTPRLGRRDEDKELTETSRSPPFAPRLGRGHQFSPAYDYDKTSQPQGDTDN